MEGSGKMCRKWIDEEEGSSKGKAEGSKGTFWEAVSSHVGLCERL